VENISIIQHWQGCNRKILSSKPTWATKQKPVSKKKKKKKERKKEKEKIIATVYYNLRKYFSLKRVTSLKSFRIASF
jgi:hypothetical protein